MSVRDRPDVGGSTSKRRRPLLAHVIEVGIRRALGDIPGGLSAYEAPLGDEGLFGPDSMVWKVHADLPGMLIGGFAALMLQTLHPLAMAGVAAHSRFREDPLGRLQRTGRFIAGTTFGPTAFAEQLIAEVRSAHTRVKGIAPDGRPYSASDPDLLTFVHVTEVSSFLAAYQRYSLRPLLSSEKDRYFAEVAEVGRRLGARDVPTSLEEVRAHLRAVRPELRRTDQAEEALEFLRRPVGDGPGDAAMHAVIVAAAIDLLPRKIRPLIDDSFELPGTSAAVRAAASAFALTTRWALGPSPVLTRSFARSGGVS